MKFGELAFVVLLLGVPLWLTLKAWRRYLTVTRTALEDLFQMRMGLTMITLSTGMWFAALVLMFLADHIAEAKSLAINLSPAVLGLINLLLRPRISRGGSRHLRRALYMPALVALRRDSYLRGFYQLLLARGKARLQAVAAVMRKLLHNLFAMFRTNQPYDGSKLCAVNPAVNAAATCA